MLARLAIREFDCASFRCLPRIRFETTSSQVVTRRRARLRCRSSLPDRSRSGAREVFEPDRTLAQAVAFANHRILFAAAPFPQGCARLLFPAPVASLFPLSEAFGQTLRFQLWS